MPFRIQAKAFFLTYAQCDLSPETLSAHLQTLATSTYILVAQELHEDGNWHLHALAIYLDKLTIRNPTFFDYEEFHPNVQSCRDRIATRAYILKSNPVQEAMSEIGSFEDGRKGSASRAAWRAAADATTKEEVMQAVLDISPRDFILSYDRVEGFANTKANRQASYVANADDIFTLPEPLSRWITTDYITRVRNSPPFGRESIYSRATGSYRSD